MKKKEDVKKGVSPVIATVLLIAMVIVIALIIFLWVRELTGETITKLDGQNIETVCEQVEFSADYSGGEVSVSNTGIVPLFNLKLKIIEPGSYNTVNMWDIGDWPTAGIGQGGSFVSNGASGQISGATKLILIPVLMGTSTNGERTYVCNEDTYSKEIVI